MRRGSPASVAATTGASLLLFVCAASSAEQQGTLTAFDGASGDEFGTAVALDGDTAIAGAPRRFAGRGGAYVLVRSGAAWTQEDAPLLPADSHASDGFGSSADVDGDTVVVGSPLRGLYKGAAYVFTRAAGLWTEERALTGGNTANFDHFGASVAVDADTVVVGAPEKSGCRGSVYVFTRSGGTWPEQQVLTAGDAAEDDLFGAAVAIDGDTVLVGAPGRGSGSGALYVFTRSGTGWTQQGPAIVAGDSAPGDAFGSSAAVSGDSAVAGAPGRNDGRGAAYFLDRAGAGFAQSGAARTAPDLSANGGLGRSVSIDGEFAVVGAPGRSDDRGAVYVFRRTGGAWPAQGSAVVANDATEGDLAGAAAAVSGDTVVAGAPRRDASRGIAFVFRAEAAGPPPPPAKGVPLILVHGINGDVTTFGPIEDPNTLPLMPMLGVRLKEEGLNVAAPFDYDKFTPAKKYTPKSIAQLAGLLRDHIRAVLEAHPGETRVDIVAHSMGGLIARAYMAGLAEDEAHDKDDPVPYRTGTAPGVIRRLVMLGTPNYGSDTLPILNPFFVQKREMSIASPFLLRLHDAWPKAIARGDVARQDLLVVAGWLGGDEAGDRTVDVSSALLPPEFLADTSTQVRYVAAWHSGGQGSPGIVFVESREQVHPSVPIIEGFLDDDPAPPPAGLALAATPRTILVVQSVDAGGRPARFSWSESYVSIDGTSLAKPRRGAPAPFLPAGEREYLYDDQPAAIAFRLQGGADEPKSHTLTFRLPKKYQPVAPIQIRALDGLPVVVNVTLVKK